MLILSLVCLALLAVAAPLQACDSCFRTPLVRFAAAEWVLVGKVTALEDQAVQALPSAGAARKQTYRVAVVEVTQALKGAEGLTSLRIGLEPCQKITVGQTACFFLFPHFEEAFWVMPHRFGAPVVREDIATFDHEVKHYQRWARLEQAPAAGLTSPDMDDRLLTAALLVSQARLYLPGIHARDRKTDPIDADLSRLVLQTLAEVNWNKLEALTDLSGTWFMNRLGPTVADGWNPGNLDDEDPKYQALARKWLIEHAATFRIRAFLRG
jgi:hypothetical protein